MIWNFPSSPLQMQSPTLRRWWLSGFWSSSYSPWGQCFNLPSHCHIHKPEALELNPLAAVSEFFGNSWGYIDASAFFFFSNRDVKIWVVMIVMRISPSQAVRGREVQMWLSVATNCFMALSHAKNLLMLQWEENKLIYSAEPLCKI